MLLLLYGSQLPPLGPSLPQYHPSSWHSESLGGAGGGGRHRWGNTEVLFSVNGSCIDLTHPSFLEFLEHLQHLPNTPQHSPYRIASFVHAARTMPHVIADSLGIHIALDFEEPPPLNNWAFFCYQANVFCQIAFLYNKQTAWERFSVLSWKLACQSLTHLFTSMPRHAEHQAHTGTTGCHMKRIWRHAWSAKPWASDDRQARVTTSISQFLPTVWPYEITSASHYLIINKSNFEMRSLRCLTLDQHSSSWSLHQTHPEGSSAQTAGPLPWSFWLSRAGWGLRTQLADKFPGKAESAGRSTLKKHCLGWFAPHLAPVPPL
jgi:hypothetical protein